MNDRLIIPIQVIKERSLIESNVEPARLLPHVVAAQRVDLQNVLGTRLFKLYLDAVQEDGTLSGLTSTQSFFLTEFITPMVCSYTEARYLFRGSVSASNTGIVRVKSDKTEPIDIEDAGRIAKGSKNDADFYAQRAKAYACLPENYNDLGSLMNEVDQNLPPAFKVNGLGIYTGPRRGDHQ